MYFNDCHRPKADIRAPEKVDLEEMTEETKKIFKMGMEAMLAVIKQVEIVEGNKEVKKH